MLLQCRAGGAGGGGHTTGDWNQTVAAAGAELSVALPSLSHPCRRAREVITSLLSKCRTVVDAALKRMSTQTRTFYSAAPPWRCTGKFFVPCEFHFICQFCNCLNDFFFQRTYFFPPLKPIEGKRRPCTDMIVIGSAGTASALLSGTAARSCLESPHLPWPPGYSVNLCISVSPMCS